MYCNAAVNDFTELFFADLILNNIVIAFDKVGLGILNRKGPFKVKLMCRVVSVNET